MTNAMTTTNGQAPAGWTHDPRMIATAKATVAKGCTDEEFAMLLHLAQRFGLDPFAKEIWAIKQGGPNQPATIMASRDGYLKAAQRDPAYRGLQAAVVREGDEFAFDAAAGTVAHRFGAKRGAIIGAWAIAHHANRMPVTCFVDFAEYKGGSPIWSKYPSAMIQKVAEVFALKRQFGINGLVTREEIDAEGPGEVTVNATPEPPPRVDAPRLASAAQLKAMFATATGLGLTEDDVKAVMWGNDLGLTNDPAKPVSTKLLTVAEASHMIDNLLPEAARGLVVDAETEGTITHE